MMRSPQAAKQSLPPGPRNLPATSAASVKSCWRQAVQSCGGGGAGTKFVSPRTGTGLEFTDLRRQGRLKRSTATRQELGAVMIGRGNGKCLDRRTTG